jgi:hypothetical protein
LNCRARLLVFTRVTVMRFTGVTVTPSLVSKTMGLHSHPAGLAQRVGDAAQLRGGGWRWPVSRKALSEEQRSCHGASQCHAIGMCPVHRCRALDRAVGNREVNNAAVELSRPGGGGSRGDRGRRPVNPPRCARTVSRRMVCTGPCETNLRL